MNSSQQTNQQEAVLAGNSASFDLSAVEESARSPLRGMNIAFLGSSVTKGHCAEGISFVEFLCKHNGCTYTKEAVSGTTIADISPDSYVQRMLSDPMEAYRREAGVRFQRVSQEGRGPLA